jgi:hypothetical protein
MNRSQLRQSRRSDTMKLMKLIPCGSLKLMGLLCLLAAAPASARAADFDSGSSGADGTFSPVSDTTIVLPPNGIMNFTTLNIPAGVTVRFASNTENIPAYILVQGDAVIDGVIDISGVDGTSVSSNPAGGFSGGLPQAESGGNGQGPSGGRGGVTSGRAGNGASYGTPGTVGSGNSVGATVIYGSTTLQPLLGGSGGGATGNSGTVPGNRGGGGGGSMLLAVTKTLTLTGSIIATGGEGAPYIPSVSSQHGGGGGSGGGVRLIASTLAGTGNIDISGGVGGTGNGGRNGGTGGIGRARLEADVFNFSGSVTPNIVATSAPLPVFASNLPSIRITSVGGSSVPVNPIGENDVILPSSIVNPVTVLFAATDVPLGSTVELTISPVSGSSSTVVSPGLSGTVASSIDSVQATLPQGASILLASVSFAVTAQTGALYAPFTDGEMVARVEIRSTMGGGSASIWLTTESGRVVELPAQVANL